MKTNSTSNAKDLLSQMQQRHDSRRDAAAEEYRQLVARCDSPKPGDIDKVQELLNVLGYSFDHFKDDVNAWREYSASEKDITPPEKVQELSDAWKASREAVAQYKIDSVKELERLEDEDRAAMGRAQDASRTNKTSKTTMAEIRQQRPHLFGDQPAAPEPAQPERGSLSSANVQLGQVDMKAFAKEQGIVVPQSLGASMDNRGPGPNLL